jgi:hypothetical protein
LRHGRGQYTLPAELAKEGPKMARLKEIVIDADNPARLALVGAGGRRLRGAVL